MLTNQEIGILTKVEARSAWLAERQKSVGASEAAAAIGVSPWMTPVELWQIKTNRSAPIAENEAMAWGTKLEPIILDEYEDRTGASVGRRQEFVRHPIHPIMTATLDGMTEDGKLVEVKTTNAFTKGFGDEEADEIPDHYRIQIHHQMACTGATEADLVVLIGGQRLRIYPVARDADLVNAIEDRVKAFWRCVESDTPPDWGKMDARALAVLFPGCEGEAEWSPVDARRVQAAIDQYEAEREANKAAEMRVEEAKFFVLEMLGNARQGRLPDGRTVRRYVETVEPKQVSYQAKGYVKNYFRVLKGERP